VAVAEPERELIRRIAPFALPVAGLAFVLGALIGGADAGWSAVIGIVVVAGNFVANGLSVAWAARISPVILYAVALGGFVLRLIVITVALLLMQQVSWFSTVAFIAALVPATVALLIVEMKLLSGRMQAELWTFPAATQGHR
jgi:hypothetical protein